MSNVIHVVAGVLYNARDQILIAQRPEGKHMAGFWEFPGGKVEPGEQAYDGLCRELEEELGVQVLKARPLIQVRHKYPDREVLLDVWNVISYQGRPVNKAGKGAEGQNVKWCDRVALHEEDILPADKPIITAIQMPSEFMVTREPEEQFDGNLKQFMIGLAHRMAHGVKAIQIRMKSTDWETLRPEMPEMLEVARRRRAKLVVNCPDLRAAGELGFHGMHLTSAQLHELEERPSANLFVSASCHNVDDVKKAEALGLDYIFLGPVKSPSYAPEVQGMGFEKFAEMVEHINMPVYAIGGMTADDLVAAWEAGGQGTASISSFDHEG